MNPRSRYDIPEATSPWQVAAFFANRHGPTALIAVTLVGLIGWLFVAKIESISETLAKHVLDNQRSQRATCVSVSILAGQPVELCDPPVKER